MRAVPDGDSICLNLADSNTMGRIDVSGQVQQWGPPNPVSGNGELIAYYGLVTEYDSEPVTFATPPAPTVTSLGVGPGTSSDLWLVNVSWECSKGIN